MNSPRRPALGGYIDHPNAGRINLQRMNGKKMKDLKKLWKMNLLCLSQAHNQAGMEREGDITIRDTITRCAAI